MFNIFGVGIVYGIYFGSIFVNFLFVKFNLVYGLSLFGVSMVYGIYLVNLIVMDIV